MQELQGLQQVQEERAALAAERTDFFATYRELFGEPSPLWGREPLDD